VLGYTEVSRVQLCVKRLPEKNPELYDGDRLDSWPKGCDGKNADSAACVISRARVSRKALERKAERADPRHQPSTQATSPGSGWRR